MVAMGRAGGTIAVFKDKRCCRCPLDALTTSRDDCRCSV